jgi:two-component system alkaline phosphatase synthesis response regulator PhoP
MKPKILVAETEQMFSEAVSYILEQAGFEVLSTADSNLVLETARDWRPDLCILSAEVPSQSHFQLCCALRRVEIANFTLPLLMVGSDGTENTRVKLLDCGVDDYLVKPFGMKEFMARIYALLRRAKIPFEQMPDREGELRVGRFHLSIIQQLLTIEDEDGKSRLIMLSRREATILHVLMSQAGFVVSREELRERVWGEGEIPPDSNALDVQWGTLRRKVEGKRPKNLQTVYGKGFRFDLEGR